MDSGAWSYELDYCAKRWSTLHECTFSLRNWDAWLTEMPGLQAVECGVKILLAVKVVRSDQPSTNIFCPSEVTHSAGEETVVNFPDKFVAEPDIRVMQQADPVFATVLSWVAETIQYISFGLRLVTSQSLMDCCVTVLSVPSQVPLLSKWLLPLLECQILFCSCMGLQPQPTSLLSMCGNRQDNFLLATHVQRQQSMVWTM